MIFISPYEILWIVMAVLLFIIEAVTPNLVTIWFAFGALGSLIAALAGVELIWQLVVFIAVTGITLILTRPLAKKFSEKKIEATNSDALIGTVCTVKEKISNLNGTGTVSVGGKIWTARSFGGEEIAVGQKVEVVKIEGVKLIVKNQNYHFI